MSKTKLEKLAAQFNEKYPVGTSVMLRKDSGDVATTVRSPAIVLSGHSAVAMFEGVSGYYSIEDNRVRASSSPVGA